jgi:teichuronic acid biosynthesis protein TuaE
MYIFQSETSDKIRLNLIKNGLVFLKDTFFLGTGTGNLEYWMSNYSVYYVGTVKNMHNYWFEILSTFGILVFISYIYFYSRLFIENIKTLKITRKNTSMYKIAIVFISLQLSFILASISSSSNISSEWLWLYWGIIISFVNIIKSKNYVSYLVKVVE